MKSLVLKSLMLIMVLQDVTTVLCKPTREATTETPSAVDRTPPIYELQMVVWPTDVDDIIEAVMPTNNELPMHTLIEEQIVVMPELDDTQDEEIINNFDDGDDDDEDFDIDFDHSSDLWPIIIGQSEPATTEPVIALENYHHKFNNGSEEYKLVLSNGMVNYQRIDHVKVKGVWRPVQQGYYTVPSQGTTRMSYQTTYYRADVNGYHVYKIEQSPRNPAYDVYLQYTKDEDNKLS